MTDIEIPLGCSWSPASQTEPSHSIGTVTVHGKTSQRRVCPQHAYDLMTQVATSDGLAVLTTDTSELLTA